MTAADLLATIAPHLASIPAGDITSIHISPYMRPREVRIHVRPAAGPTLADTLCDRAAETTTETRVDGALRSGHITAPMRDMPGYALVWLTDPTP